MSGAPKILPDTMDGLLSERMVATFAAEFADFAFLPKQAAIQERYAHRMTQHINRRAAA